MTTTVTGEEIIKLANLARIELTPEEPEIFAREIQSILGYVGQINDVAGDVSNTKPLLRNVMREDEITNATGEYTESILQNAPARNGNYLEVKKIL